MGLHLWKEARKAGSWLNVCGEPGGYVNGRTRLGVRTRSRILPLLMTATARPGT